MVKVFFSYLMDKDFKAIFLQIVLMELESSTVEMEIKLKEFGKPILNKNEFLPYDFTEYFYYTYNYLSNINIFI